MNNEYVQWHENFLRYYKSKISKKKKMPLVLENHPILDTEQAIQNRMKNYTRRDKNNGYQRAINLDDLFSICKATQANPNDILLFDASTQNYLSHTISQLTVLDLAQIIKSCGRTTKERELFWSCFPFSHKNKKDIFLPGDLIFVSSLLDHSLKFFWKVYELDCLSSKKRIYYQPFIDYESKMPCYIWNLFFDKRLINAKMDFEDVFFGATWSISSNNSLMTESSEKQYSKFSNHNRFEMSFSAFLYAMSIKSIQQSIYFEWNKNKIKGFMIEDYFDKHPEIQKFIAQLLNNAMKQINSNSLINCHGIIITQENPITASDNRQIKGNRVNESFNNSCVNDCEKALDSQLQQRKTNVTYTNPREDR